MRARSGLLRPARPTKRVRDVCHGHGHQKKKKEEKKEEEEGTRTPAVFRVVASQAWSWAGEGKDDITTVRCKELVPGHAMLSNTQWGTHTHTQSIVNNISVNLKQVPSPK
ncbi:unnamed protein product [Symbiodinium natans]|uniref:Uncharacterized protein n=1 Tax=Symbiodinium natans TaxID=878477 RepID=A0A812NRG3_9DINO|nr:unnamed protein product [Symbiodinium natans]